jgi:hypothetical protein
MAMIATQTNSSIRENPFFWPLRSINLMNSSRAGSLRISLVAKGETKRRYVRFNLKVIRVIMAQYGLDEKSPTILLQDAYKLSEHRHAACTQHTKRKDYYETHTLSNITPLHSKCQLPHPAR